MKVISSGSEMLSAGHRPAEPVRSRDSGMQRGVVLSGSIGLGHQMMAQAITDVLHRYGWQLRTLDCMAMLGPVAGRAGDWAFHRLMSVPGLYDALHFAHLRTGSRLAQVLDGLAAAQLTPHLQREFAVEQADVVFSVFATGAAAAARLKQVWPELRTVVLCTDVAVHRLWVHEGTDLFLVTSEAAAASVYRHQPRALVAVIPPPVRQGFYQAPSRTAARAALDLSPDAPCIALIDSGWGFAPLAAMAGQLTAAGIAVLAVAGHNRAVEAQLRGHADQTGLLRAFGYTDRVPELMAAADLVVTLPGATTCSEARVVGRELVLLDGMPGHGRDNLQHELAMGSARVCDPTPPALTECVLAALDSSRRPARVPRHQPQAWGEAFVEALTRIGVQAHRPAAVPPADLAHQRPGNQPP